jgi:aspartyl protease family protein
MLVLVGVIAAQIESTPKAQAHAQGGSSRAPRPTPPTPPVPSRAAQVKIRSEGAHYYPRVTINGTPVRMVADTGATFVTLSTEDARKVGIDPRSLQFTGKAHTANGTVQSAPIMLSEITVEGTVLRNVRASCCVTGDSLLGMSALERFSFTMNNGWMFLLAKG